MKNRKVTNLATMSVLALSCLITGCDREISKTESKTTSSDGTVKTKEKTVKESSDGTVTTKEESKTTTTNKP